MISSSFLPPASLSSHGLFGRRRGAGVPSETVFADLTTRFGGSDFVDEAFSKLGFASAAFFVPVLLIVWSRLGVVLADLDKTDPRTTPPDGADLTFWMTRSEDGLALTRDGWDFEGNGPLVRKLRGSATRFSFRLPVKTGCKQHVTLPKWIQCQYVYWNVNATLTFCPPHGYTTSSLAD